MKTIATKEYEEEHVAGGDAAETASLHVLLQQPPHALQPCADDHRPDNEGDGKGKSEWCCSC
jgi:hypothetical protein